MYKIAIIRKIQKIKILFQFFIKKIFSLFFLFLFSCTGNFDFPKDIEPTNLRCGSNSSIEFFEKNGSFSEGDKDFNFKLKLVDKNFDKRDFNFIYISEPKNSGGYTLELIKIFKKANKHHIYFKENKPPENSANVAAITSTYCFLKIEKLADKIVFIK